jgi:16S rRNA (guanine527-N7)-methyltransferase
VTDDGAAVPPALVRVLETAREHGFLGPGPIDRHVRHAFGFAQAVTAAGASFDSVGRDHPGVDLGSGGGVPGLVLAVSLPSTHWVLLDANQRRTSFLRGAVDALGLDGRVTVLNERAERTGRSERHRGRSPIVVARGFAGPAPTAECAAPLLRPGGLLIVSEPPPSSALSDGDGYVSPHARPGIDRWPADGLARAGLVECWRSPAGEEFQFFAAQRTDAVHDELPRREGLPEKRPLF